jgi:CIC family chloride channel protein
MGHCRRPARILGEEPGLTVGNFWTSRMPPPPGATAIGSPVEPALDSATASAPPIAATRTAGKIAESPAVSRHRRQFGDMVMHAPHTLRALVRSDELWLVVLAAFIGCAAGVLVAVMTYVTQLMHQHLFLLNSGQRLSGMVSIDPIRAVAVPTIGGLAVGLLGLAVARLWSRQVVDPIEANALHGGRMSLNDSLIVVAQTVLSSGVGASVGLEAGYTQISSAVASRFGRMFRVRRNDLRLLVGCGAAGAIAGAFNAPLTGAFYAFELVIGTYTLGTLAPVAVAAIIGSAVVGALHMPGDYGGLELQVPSRIEAVDYIAILTLGVLCALVGIAIMRGVTLTEQLFRRSRVPVWLRPAIGGLAIGCMALITPQMMSSGHAALAVGIDAPYTLSHIGLLIVLKALASAISIGSGFRGGLFFASLLMGAMVGKLFTGVLAVVTTAHAIPPVIGGLIAMSAMAVAVVGGPLTMGFLALETTGSLPLTGAVLAACIVSTLTVRRAFGYSFATWRFHLRGEVIRSAVDIGWMRSLTVGRMMRREVRTVRADTALTAFRRDFPLGSEQRMIVVDNTGAYAGIVLVAEAHVDSEGAKTVGDILHYTDTVLLAQMSVKKAIELFEAAESDALAVVDGVETKQVIGMLTEHYALRRYSDELDRRRRDLSGE